MKSVSIRIAGKVQGVFFRKSAKAMAVSLGLHGFVRNQPDGRVYLEATGEDETLTKLIDWCRQGPDRAVVTEVVVMDISLKQMEGFTIQRAND